MLNKQLRTAKNWWSSELAGSCEHGNKPSDFIEDDEFLD